MKFLMTTSPLFHFWLPEISLQIGKNWLALQGLPLMRYDLAKFWLAANVEIDPESLPDPEPDGGSQTKANKKVTYYMVCVMLAITGSKS